MKKENLQAKVNEVKGSDKAKEMIGFMLERGYTVDQYINVGKSSDEAIKALETYFSEVAVDGTSPLKDEDGKIDLNKIKEIQKKTKKNNTKNKQKDGIKNEEDGKNINNKENQLENPNGIENPKNNEDGKGDNENMENLVLVNPTNENKGGNENPTPNQEPPKNENNEPIVITPTPTPQPTPEEPPVSDKPKTKAQKLREYKTIDNLIFLAENKTTTLENVREIGRIGEDMIFSCELTGSQIATMYLAGTLIFDPSMQRGVKEDKEGKLRANFKDQHVKDIAKAMEKRTFTPTQMHFAIIESDTTFEYDERTEELVVNGYLRLADGQHRSRACAKLHTELMLGKIDNVDLDKYVFNVQIHATTEEHARVIYSNIDKNLRLDKSQAKQLSADQYARVVNALNQSSDSPLKDKIATCKPVGNRVVLFNNFTDALEKSVTISTNIQRGEIVDYLKNFFDYLIYKCEDGFGGDDKKRKEFRKVYLLNENNFFPAWIKIAFLNKEEYKKNIDHIIENIEVFRKDNPFWLEKNTVKVSQKKDSDVKTYAMNNTSTGLNAIVAKAMEVLGVQEN